jgi:hypothetical protein
MEMKMGAIPGMASNGHADDKMVDEPTPLLAASHGVTASIHRRRGLFGATEDIGRTETQAELVEECAEIATLELISEGRS